MDPTEVSPSHRMSSHDFNSTNWNKWFPTEESVSIISIQLLETAVVYKGADKTRGNSHDKYYTIVAPCLLNMSSYISLEHYIATVTVRNTASDFPCLRLLTCFLLLGAFIWKKSQGLCTFWSWLFQIFSWGKLIDMEGCAPQNPIQSNELHFNMIALIKYLHG